MRTLILCGGKGTRARPHTDALPKPLLEVAGRPVLLHLMEVFAIQGFRAFLLAGGFRTDLLEAFAASLPSDWTVDVVDTGAETGTGGRVAQCFDRLGDEAFVTYGDGLGNVDLAALLACHRGSDASMTMTTVPLPSPYGTIDVDDAGRVRRFREKPVLEDELINAGFFVVDQRARRAFEAGDDLEREVLPALAAAGELQAYRHRGFWRSMDTYKDALELSAMCTEGVAPWMPSAAPASS